MLLTGSEIEKQVLSGGIQISPFSSSQINPNSYNYRLSPCLLEVTDSTIDPLVTSQSKEYKIPENGFTLLPGRLYLGCTLEKIGSSEFVPSLIGRSSLGRLGLFLQITADLGQLGTFHAWTLELTVVQPLILYPKMIVGQVCFWKTEGDLNMLYDGKYSQDIIPQSSKLYQEFYDSHR